MAAAGPCCGGPGFEALHRVVGRPDAVTRVDAVDPHGEAVRGPVPRHVHRLGEGVGARQAGLVAHDQAVAALQQPCLDLVRSLIDPVAVADLRPPDCTVAAVLDAGGEAFGAVCDVTDAGSVGALVAEVLDCRDGIDGLV
jgi:hypothetical protein